MLDLQNSPWNYNNQYEFVFYQDKQDSASVSTLLAWKK